MRVGLFIPCYIDQLNPGVGIAVVEVLARLGVSVDCPEKPSCCGQPMANSGCPGEAAPLAEQFVQAFADAEYVVCPSGSCTAMIREHYDGLVKNHARLVETQAKTFEFCEFLTDVLGIDDLGARLGGSFVGRVGLHKSCHGLRELRLGKSSETRVAPFDKVQRLLESIEGVEVVSLDRTDECCGFGGTFAVAEEAVSCQMGADRVADHRRAGAEAIASTDMSCLMHMGGLIARQEIEQQGSQKPGSQKPGSQKPGESLRVMHLAEIFAESMKSGAAVQTGSRADESDAEESQ